MLTTLKAPHNQSRVQPVLGHGAVGHAEQVFQSRGGVPMLGQREFAARAAQAIDDLVAATPAGRIFSFPWRNPDIHTLVAMRHRLQGARKRESPTQNVGVAKPEPGAHETWV
jgi:hypothetical protein